MAGRAEQRAQIAPGGGGALELVEGKVLPGVDAVDEAYSCRNSIKVSAQSTQRGCKFFVKHWQGVGVPTDY